MSLDRTMSFTMFTKIIHGCGSIKLIPDECKRLKITQVMVVTDEGLVKSGLVNEITSVLGKANIPFIVYDKIEVDPSMKTVHDGVALCQEQRGNGIVILGGGSCLCAGKAIAMLAANGGKVADYHGVGKVRVSPLPVIAIPTTAGSGSEVSPTFLIHNEEKHSKIVVNSYLDYPPAAILDPNLLRSLPLRQAIWSSLDALTHAIESLCTNLSNPLTDAIALRSIQMMNKSLLRAAFTDDMAAKSDQLLASSMANVACGNTKLGLAHAFSFPFANLKIAHGLACGLMLPFAMDFNLPACKAQFAEIAVALGEKPDQTADILAHKAVGWVRNLYVEAGFPTRITEKEVPREKLDQVIKEAAATTQVKFNIRRTTEQDLLGIMERAYAGF